MRRILPLLLSLVFLLSGCAPTEAPPSERWDLMPMLMDDGVLYIDTGYAAAYVSSEAGPEYWDGEITSEVDGSERPAEDDQSNFGSGYGYRYGTREGTIKVLMGYRWAIFATEDVREEMQFPEG